MYRRRPLWSPPPRPQRSLRLFESAGSDVTFIVDEERTRTAVCSPVARALEPVRDADATLRSRRSRPGGKEVPRFTGRSSPTRRALDGRRRRRAQGLGRRAWLKQLAEIELATRHLSVGVADLLLLATRWLPQLKEARPSLRLERRVMATAAGAARAARLARRADGYWLAQAPARHAGERRPREADASRAEGAAGSTTRRRACGLEERLRGPGEPAMPAPSHHPTVKPWCCDVSPLLATDDELTLALEPRVGSHQS